MRGGEDCVDPERARVQYSVGSLSQASAWQPLPPPWAAMASGASADAAAAEEACVSALERWRDGGSEAASPPFALTPADMEEARTKTEILVELPNRLPIAVQLLTTGGLHPNL